MIFFVHSFDSNGSATTGRAGLSVALERLPASRAGGLLPGLLSTDPRGEECHVSRADRLGACRLRSAGRGAELPGKTELTARMWQGPVASNEQ